MRALRFAGWLLAALLTHLSIVALAPGLATYVDPFLLLIVFQGLSGRVLAAVLAGCVAGLLLDALSGGLFGMYGLAGTVVGYVAARFAQLLSLERRRFVALLFCMSAVVQQIVVLLLLVLLVTGRDLPTLGDVSLRIVVTGIAGSLLFGVGERFSLWQRAWREARQPRVRWGVER